MIQNEAPQITDDDSDNVEASTSNGTGLVTIHKRSERDAKRKRKFKLLEVNYTEMESNTSQQDMLTFINQVISEHYYILFIIIATIIVSICIS